MTRYRSSFVITYETAAQMVAAAMSEGISLGVRVVVSIVDPSFTLIAFGKSDETRTNAELVSRRKASTSAATGAPTGGLPESLAVPLSLISDNLLTNLKGGFPIQFDGHLVGGIGISGGHPDEDVAIALASLTAVGADRG